MSERTKITLDESEIPRQWYNVIPDLPAPPPPPLHPGTLQPVGPEDLAPLFPMELIRQEVATDSYIDIPADVNSTTTYPIAVVKDSKQSKLAAAWTKLVLSDTGRSALADHGFAAP